MSSAVLNRRRAKRKRAAAGGRKGIPFQTSLAPAINIPWLMLAGSLALGVWWFNKQYSIGFQNPVHIRFAMPIVITERTRPGIELEAEADQGGKPLSKWQRYACTKFGPDCRLALAIQRAENMQGKCEIYHYNSDGSLDWGYFQINTVHLQRRDVNLRDLLDCKANIDFAHKLYLETGGFTPWSTYKNGRYRQFLAAN